MNSYHLGLSGSWWWLILLIVLATGFTLFVYRRTVPEIPTSKKAILVTLRWIAIFLLLFILFEPMFTLIRGAFEKPKLAVLLDNSLSMALVDAKGDRKQDYKNAVAGSDFLSLPESQRNIISFDYDTKEYKNFNFDSLKLKGQLTDISKSFKFVNQVLEKEKKTAAEIKNGKIYFRRE